MQLSDGRHVARWRDPLSGASKQESLDRLNLTSDAKRRKWAKKKSETLAELRRAVSLGSVITDRMTIRSAVADHLAEAQNPRTKVNKQIVLEAFATWCETKQIKSTAELTSPWLMKWRGYMLSPQRCTHAASTRNRWLIASGIFLRWCIPRGLVPLLNSDTIKSACKREKEPEDVIEFLRPAALQNLLECTLKHDAEAVGWKLAPFVLALLLSGCRFQEIACLSWSEVDLDHGEIVLPASRTKTQKGRRIVFAETPALGDLLRALRPDPAEGLVFDVRHSTWDAARKRLIASYGAPEFSAHTLRRSAGTILTNAPGIYGGASAWLSAKRLGHSVQQAQAHYAEALPGLPAEARTLEAAAGLEDVCRRIIAAIKGVK